MSDVFGATNEFGGVFRGTTFRVANNSTLVQDVQVSYSRQISRVWELGSMKQYYIEGHTEGQGTIGHIVGPQGLVNALVSQYADVCSGTRTMTLESVTTACGGLSGGNSSITLGGVLAQAVQLQASAQNHMINSSMQMMFTAMDVGG